MYIASQWWQCHTHIEHAVTLKVQKGRRGKLCQTILDCTGNKINLHGTNDLASTAAAVVMHVHTHTHHTHSQTVEEEEVVAVVVEGGTACPVSWSSRRGV